jgi:Xaa-Pro aminopeptidase
MRRASTRGRACRAPPARIRCAPANVITVEPGVYLPGECGVRIEDLLVVRAGGHEVLTGLPKELTAIV